MSLSGPSLLPPLCAKTGSTIDRLRVNPREEQHKQVKCFLRKCKFLDLACPETQPSSAFKGGSWNSTSLRNVYDRLQRLLVQFLLQPRKAKGVQYPLSGTSSVLRETNLKYRFTKPQRMGQFESLWLTPGDTLHLLI